MMVMSQGAEVTVSPFTVKVADIENLQAAVAQGGFNLGDLLSGTGGAGRAEFGDGNRTIVIALRPVGGNLFAVERGGEQLLVEHGPNVGRRGQRSGRGGREHVDVVADRVADGAGIMELLNSSRGTGGVGVLTDDDAALRDDEPSAAAPSLSISNQELVYITSMVTFGTIERTPRKKAV